MPSLYQSIRAQRASKQLYDFPNTSIAFGPQKTPQKRNSSFTPGSRSNFTPKRTTLSRAIADRERRSASMTTPPTRASTAASPGTGGRPLSPGRGTVSALQSAKKGIADMRADTVRPGSLEEPALPPQFAQEPEQPARQSQAARQGQAPPRQGQAAARPSSAARSRSTGPASAPARPRPGEDGGSTFSAKKIVQWSPQETGEQRSSAVQQAKSREVLGKSSSAADVGGAQRQPRAAGARQQAQAPIKWVDSRGQADPSPQQQRSRTSPAPQMEPRQDLFNEDGDRGAAAKGGLSRKTMMAGLGQRRGLGRSQTSTLDGSRQPDSPSRSPFGGGGPRQGPPQQRPDSPQRRPGSPQRSMTQTQLVSRPSTESTRPQFGRAQTARSPSAERGGRTGEPYGRAGDAHLPRKMDDASLDTTATAGPSRSQSTDWRHSMVPRSNTTASARYSARPSTDSLYAGGGDFLPQRDTTPRRTDRFGRPQVWGGTWDKKMHGGHYEFEVGPHAQRMGEELAQKKALDSMLADDHENARARSLTPRPQRALMRTAFTDRSMRLRDQGRVSWAPREEGPLAGTPPADDGGNLGGGKEISGSGRDPRHSHPAGVVSYRFISAKTVHSCHTDAEGASQLRSPDWEHPKNYISPGMRKAIHSRDDDIHSRPEVAEEQHLLGRSMGRKNRGEFSPRTRSSAARRSVSEDPRAGDTIRRGVDTLGYRKGKQDWQTDSTPSRSNMAMIVAPSTDDPAPPMKITDCSKACPDSTPSVDAEKLAVKWNQPLYRYEMASVTGEIISGRARSQPPESRNPVTHDGFRDQLHKRGDRRATPSRRNVSHAMSQVTNHDRLREEFDAHRGARLASDKQFSELCSHTSEHRVRRHQELGDIQDKNHHTRSSNMAATLRWE